MKGHATYAAQLREQLYQLVKAELTQREEDNVDLEVLDIRMRELADLYNNMAIRLRLPVRVSFRFNPVKRNVGVVFDDIDPFEAPETVA